MRGIFVSFLDVEKMFNGICWKYIFTIILGQKLQRFSKMLCYVQVILSCDYFSGMPGGFPGGAPGGGSQNAGGPTIEEVD